jgi:hypothetical protein
VKLVRMVEAQGKTCDVWWTNHGVGGYTKDGTGYGAPGEPFYASPRCGKPAAAQCAFRCDCGACSTVYYVCDECYQRAAAESYD